MTLLDDLKESIKQEIGQLDMVIGWKQGFDPLHTSPYFMYREEDVDQLQWSPLCSANLAGYLPGLKGKKVGLVLKGCDSRSVAQLIQEGFAKREDLTLFGVYCPGNVNTAAVKKALRSPGTIKEASWEGDTLKLKTSREEASFPLEEVLLNRCFGPHPHQPVLFDHLLGEPRDKELCGSGSHPELQALEEMELEDRFAYWLRHMDRCIRCYACRNACPMCVCKDHCIADTRDPHWMSQETGVRQKWMYQLIHAMHLAGRCTECGECERACPMEIPILSLRRKMNQEIASLFDYQAGLDPEALIPLMTFKPDEEFSSSGK